MRHLYARLAILMPLCLLLSIGTGVSAQHRLPTAASHITQTTAKDAVVVDPVSGRTPWAIILCKFSDQPAEPQPPSYFSRFMTEAGAGTGGMFDYWRDMSYGAVDLTGSVVKGWYTMPYTLGTSMSRAQRIDACINTARNDVNFPAYYGIVAIINAVTDSGSIGRQARTLNGVTKTYGLVLLDPWAWNVSFAGHEMGHGYGLDHSFDAALSSCGGNPGEYCDKWDIMSAMNIWTYQGNYGNAASNITFSTGPQLNAAYRDALGWLPANRQFWITDLGSAQPVTLAALDRPDVNGWLMTKIFYDPANHQHYYTVEFRRKTGWDQGIPRDAVLIHDVRPDGHSYLIAATNTTDLGAGQSFWDPANNIVVTVNAIDSASSTATITFRPISLFVSTAGNDGNSCLSTSSACRTLGAAVAKAPPGNTVTIASGTYLEHLTITKRVTLVGQNVVVR